MNMKVLGILLLGGILTACGGGSGGNDGGTPTQQKYTINGTISNYYSGEPLTGATVILSTLQDGAPHVVAQTQTSDDGSYTLQGSDRTNRLVLTARSPGFGAQSKNLPIPSENATISVDERLLPAQLSSDFDPTAASDLSIGGMNVVSLPANAFVDADGQAPSGNVSANVTVIDPSADASVMPGDYQTVDTAGGGVQQIESFGALDASFTDADGQALQLADGASATLRIPLAASVDPGSAAATIPLYYFDESSGYWVEEGTATLTQTDAGWAYVGTVSHFTTWNADQVYNTVNISGCVQDADGQMLSDVSVSSFGQDYNGSATTRSDADGNFSVAARVNSQVLISGTSSTQSQTITVETGDSDQTLQQCLILAPSAATIKLTWGENPRDLDSHLTGPSDVDGSDGMFHIYYGNKSEIIDGTLISLDVDDTQSFGPEIITIPRFPLPGTYHYYVNLYAGSSTIAASPARVELNLQGQVRVFSPDAASGDPSAPYWHVFDLIVADDGTVTTTVVQQFSDSETLPSANAVTAAASKRQARPAIAESYVLRKYYSR
ncbi:carboxypeptidase regulatory-like domain-containing protein [Solimonas marina]|uniref:Carboxypeptidase regulatory-like domain-containing protein n=1 Tax=Solimonas marina TaxID=2714601 RepID=A0A969WAM8_9GAMM|nr:carboxypeptidase regulatory-like domain-containing protein [Solimonas marina]NKF23672.1 hypothetical protein [Solimonas marina]